MILFAAGDVGGARAILPLPALCESKKVPFQVLEHGHIMQEVSPLWPTTPVPQDLSPSLLVAWLKSQKTSLLIFASSVHDTLALSLARAAKDQKIPVIHVLDNWSSYRLRLENDGLPLLLPDAYTLMDDLAFEAALKEGLPEEILHITGQPALAALMDTAAAFHGASIPKNAPLSLLFVSEPAEADQGSGPESPHFRGYTEKEVLRLCCKALQPRSAEIQIRILPHPREDRQELAKIWEKTKGKLCGEVLDQAKINGRDAMLEADGIIGMTSILLYEAWLLGKPVLSLQPGLRQKASAILALREGVFFTDKKDAIPAILSDWLSTFSHSPVPKADLHRHKEAASRILELGLKHLHKKNSPQPERRTP